MRQCERVEAVDVVRSGGLTSCGRAVKRKMMRRLFPGGCSPLIFEGRSYSWYRKALSQGAVEKNLAPTANRSRA